MFVIFTNRHSINEEIKIYNKELKFNNFLCIYNFKLTIEQGEDILYGVLSENGKKISNEISNNLNDFCKNVLKKKKIQSLSFLCFGILFLIF